jgi:hypothetical protein
MGYLIQNVPIGCIYCGYKPVPGNVTKTKVNEKVLIECRWVCPRCNQLVRADEKYVNPKDDENV